ncbi:MAG: quinone oxidoreductase family protein, partial [Flavobacteriales bacterium]
PAEELLALCTQGVTAYYMASYLTPVRAGDTVLIHAAAGGVGTLLIQLAKLQGAKVIAKVGRTEKESLVKALGADHVVNYNTSDYVESIIEYLGEERIDLSFNPVAGSTFKQDISILKIADNKPMVLKHCLTEVFKLYQSGKVKPQSGGSYSAHQLNEAHTALENGLTTGKLIVNW